jgi:hypothetical protein
MTGKAARTCTHLLNVGVHIGLASGVTIFRSDLTRCCIIVVGSSGTQRPLPQPSQANMGTKSPNPGSVGAPQQQSPFQTVQHDQQADALQMLPEVPPLPALNIRTRMPMQQPASSSAGPRAVEMSSRNMPSGYGYAGGSSPQIDWDALETSSDDSEDVYGGA